MRRCYTGTQFGEVSGLWRVFLRGRQSQVGKVKAGPVFLQRGDDVSDCPLFWVEDVRAERQRWKRETSVHEPLSGRHLREGRPGDAVQVRVAQCPLVHVHGLNRAKSVQTLKMIHGRRKRVHSLQEGIVGQLQRGVKGDWGRQSLASHFSRKVLEQSWSRGAGQEHPPTSVTRGVPNFPTVAAMGNSHVLNKSLCFNPERQERIIQAS